MGAGRPRIPVEVKKFQGTLNSTRDKKQELAETTVNKTLPKSPLRMAKEIENSEVKKAYREHIKLLRAVGCETGADNPLLKTAYLCLEASMSYWEIMQNLSFDDEEYDIYLKRYFKFFDKYEEIVKQFYLTPNARIKLALDTMTVQEKQLNIQSQEESLISKMLKAKES